MPQRAAILLSTYNGALFLDAQLHSIVQQQGVDWLLYWRDDGSSDRSLAMMLAFAAGPGAGRCRQVDVPGHLGAIGSFMALLRHAAPSGMPVAFADQDDVWLPHKLARGLAALAPAQVPTLYCSRQVLVDSALVRLRESARLSRPPCFASALAQNIATGCTVMLNPQAADLVADSVPPGNSLHDWWSYLVVTASGGRVIADPAATVLYRQHGRNLVGAPRFWLQRATAAVRRGPAMFMGVMRSHVAALLSQPGLLSPESSATLGAIDRALAGGPATRLAALRLPGLLRQTWLETLLFRWWFLTG